MRIFFKEGSSVIEVTNDVNRFKDDTYLMSLATTDGIYLAVDFPLNHLYVKMGQIVNEISSSLLIDYWSSEGWTRVVNFNDSTSAFTRSGFIDFTPDRDISWLRESTNSNGESVDDLTSIVVYDKFWVRIKVDTTLTSNIELDWIGNIFSDDTDLYAEYPIFNDASFRTGFEDGKLDWQEQHVKAADLIVQDLKRKNVILGREQILDRDILLPASVCKVAEMIFNAFGNDYKEQWLRARSEYQLRIDLSNFVVDNDSDGIKDVEEVAEKQGWLSR